MSENSVLTVEAVLGVAAGVAISIIFPVLLGYVRDQFKPVAGRRWRLPPWAKKYGALALFSFLTAVLVLAVYEQTEPQTQLTFLGAVLLGFGWESSLEKFLRPPIGVDEAGSAAATTRTIDETP